jgi:hypothetical protein
MKQKRTIWTTITGGLTSTAPILLATCKSGACVGVCASPVASLFGVSSATIASSPVMSVIEPLLIAISAVSFTISYYSLYVIPKLNCNTANVCDCAPNEKEIRKTKRRKAIFWIGLTISVVALPISNTKSTIRHLQRKLNAPYQAKKRKLVPVQLRANTPKAGVSNFININSKASFSAELCCLICYHC